MRERMVKYIKWLLPVLFIAYYGSISLFTHVHIENGTTIVHAHPFKKANGGANHHHASLAEIQLFHILSSVYAMDGAVHSLQMHYYSTFLFDYSESPFLSGHINPVEGKHYLRAPPII